MSAKLKRNNVPASSRLPPEKANERAETPDSLIGSGSDGASEELPGPSRLAKVKDSESEFGSLNSLKIADEDDDSCIGQKSAKIVVSQGDTEDFELKRVTTEVVHRSNSGVLSQQNSTWDIASTANDFSDDECSPGGNNRLAASSQVGNRAGGSGAYTTSRSMSNLRPAMAYTATESPRRPRKKWDISGESAGYASPMMMHQSASGPQGFVTYSPNGMQPPSQQPSGINQQHHGGGFMTMNGTHIYHAPNAIPRQPENTYMNSSVSTPGINQLGDSHPRGQMPSSSPRVLNDQLNAQHTPTGSYASVNRPSATGNGYVQNVLHNMDASFDRQNQSRCSLTKRFLNTPTADEQVGDAQPRTVWTPPAMSARRSTSNMHYSTPSGGTASSIVRRQSEMHNSSGTRLYQQNGSNGPSSGTGEDSKSIRRARTMHRLKHRRMTIGSVEQTPAGANALNSPKEEDYVTSDLHLRSRSQSPSQLALNAIVDGTGSRRQRQDSDMSMYSTVTITSSRLTPASSRTNLRTIGVTNRQSSQALNKLNEMRDKLRKSQENLAGAIGDELSSGGPSSSSLMSRSRSIGNLRFTAAAPLSSQRNEINGASGNASHSEASSYIPATPIDAALKNCAQSTPLSTRNRYMARSVGSLHNNQDGAENGDEEIAPARLNDAKSPRRLAQTIESLKKASNPDLTQASLYNASPSEGHDSFMTASPLGKQRGKGAVQKRVERYQPRSRISRDTTSGESDSNASDANGSPLLHGSVGSGGQQTLPKRYFNAVNGSNRSVSSVEGMPRPGLLQSTRRIFEQQRTTSSPTVPRRAPNYLAQKLAGADIVGPDMGAEECPRHAASPNEASALNDFDGKTPQSKQMARHLAECIEQFNTGLDKVLQARQLLESSQHLPSDDKDTLLRVLNQTIRTGRRRLDVNDDSDGVRSESPNSIISQRQNVSQNGAPSVNATSGQPELDTAALLQQHAPQIIAYLQQNMAKQN